MTLVVALATAGTVLVVVGIAGKIAAAPLATAALRGAKRRSWRTACAASTVLSWALTVIAIEWLIVIAGLKWSQTPSGELISSAIFGGLVLWYITVRLPRISTAYWRALSATLGAAVTKAGTPEQRELFRRDHVEISRGGRSAHLALARILAR